MIASGGGAEVEVDVVHALPGRAMVQRVALEAGATVADAIAAAGCEALLTQAGVGVWGRRVSPDCVVQHGDRVEIYRALEADPKEARRRRAAGGGAS